MPCIIKLSKTNINQRRLASLNAMLSKSDRPVEPLHHPTIGLIFNIRSSSINFVERGDELL